MILFFGPPGSGKSVQGKLLIERNGWQWLSTGELFRNSKDPEVLQRLATGELIDDELTNKVLDAAIRESKQGVPVVLDGYPRNLAQVQWLADYLPGHGRRIECVILFEVPREELIKRLAGRGRVEDTPDVISRRLDIYQEKTSPVVDYYRDKGVAVIAIDGTGAINDVHERIQKAVESCLPTK
ncbi:MAG TPA: nucleoside monophosphate kinase [Candidatus Pristimantibacillus sp.]|jgi:adenylate kinase|nr:nucleoside monophosphate kinase [Candidatus Pristimantibacillus sp.]